MIRRAPERGAVRDTVSIPDGEYAVLARCIFGRDGEVPASLERLAATAREMGVPLASHDDDTPEVRTSYRALGCKICEFPADAATAECARAAGDEIILGAPNILRGGSHCGRAGAREMIRQGLCTILCSDYYYPALPIAPFLLAAERITPFGEAWDLVSKAPARAAGLTDRGTLAPGMRADMLFIDDEDVLNPEVRAAFVEGVPVFTRGLVPDGSSVIDT
jgi:alpha-D-ribose 1-methylphosphonate 5-triphosphate diphosphatase